MRIFRLAGAIAISLALSLPAMASSIPPQGRLDFDVIRKGKDIGDISYSFSGNKDDFTVNVVTDIAVKVPLLRLNAYVFRQNSIEHWVGGKLATVRSATDDDGEKHQVSAPAGGLVPGSLWNDEIVRANQVFNTIDGRVMSVRVVDLGTQAIKTRSGRIMAHHYRITGDLERDVWYDSEGNLARVSFTADDGSTITYVRR